MKIDLKGIKLNLISDSGIIDPTKKTIIFFHGFGGAATDWKFIFSSLPSGFQALAIDLIGHGSSDSPIEAFYYSAESINSQIREVIKSIDITNPILCGYSMGGRVALGYAINYPKEISALILESSSPGIIEAKEREIRALADSRLSERLETIGIEKFFNLWYEQPLFNSLKSNLTLFEKTLKNKTKQNITGLRNSLKYFSPGLMNSYWNQLNKISVLLLLISGELDRKYCDINRKINSILDCSQLEIINGAGHNTHLEKPDEFIKLVNNFLKGLN
ncbi:MAG: 2-succinyl-6-hydroxy-2,4-cyclohexadiene-1-carboxylate synthase [Melioribacteraceae bacterium]|nr:2-succinyl-6-hydroxy-2,4-cyclohexadiene-1-carboxylate synthase [Melioribacteraceae bacterium]